MRILHVANFNVLKYGDAYYSVGRKLSNGLVRNGHFVYDFSHRDVARTENIFHAKALGARRMNRRLLETVDKLRPELLLFGHSELVTAETVRTIKEQYGIPVAMWYVDPVYEDTYLSHIHARLPYLNVFFCTTGGRWLDPFARGKTRSRFIPNPVDASVEDARNFERAEFDYDVVYCGRDRRDPGRRSFVELAQARLRHARFKVVGSLGAPVLFGDRYMQTLRTARMGISYSRRNDVCLYASDRIAHLTGNGLLTLSPRVPGLQQLYAEDEIAYFSDVEELAARVDHLLRCDDERRHIARNGWLKAHSAYSATRIARYMLEEIFGLPFTERYEWQNLARPD